GRAAVHGARARPGAWGGHAGAARRPAAGVRFNNYDEPGFFCPDDAPAEVAAARRAGFMRLAAAFRTRFAETVRHTEAAMDGLSDLQFTEAYRGPFQYSRFVRQHLRAGTFVRSSDAVMLHDLDVN